MTDESGTSAYTYDVLGQMTSDDGPLPNDTVAYTYDGLGRGKTMMVNGADTVTYNYDALRRLSTINSSPGLHTYAYNGNTNMLSSLTRPNGTKTNYSFDSLERLTSIQSLKSDNVTNISKYNYAFDNTTHKEGRISMERQYQATTLQHINYGYDNTSQLTSALSTETPTALENFTYSYDAMGNHNQWKKGGGSTVTGGITKTYTNNNLNQVTNLSTATNTAGTVTTDTLAMSYDLQGGLNVSYPSNGTTYSILIYDDANRLKQVLYRLKSTDALTKQVLYFYDGANRKRRTIEEDWNGTAWTFVSDKRYVYDGMNVLQERNGTGTTVVAKHVWGKSLGGGIGGLLSRTEVSTSANYFYHYDGSGNVMQLTDSMQAVAARYDYDSWGVTQTNSGPYSNQPYRWSTKEQDAVTGLYYYGFRFYSPSLRTWINRDPIGEMGGLNLYGFNLNSPTNYVDEFGHGPLKIASRVGEWGLKAGRRLSRADARRIFKKEGGDILGSKQQIKKWSKKKGSHPVIEKHGDGTLHGHPGGKSRNTSTGKHGGHGFIDPKAGVFIPGGSSFMDDFGDNAAPLTAEHWAKDQHPIIQEGAKAFDYFNPLSLPKDIADLWDLFDGDDDPCP